MMEEECQEMKELGCSDEDALIAMGNGSVNEEKVEGDMTSSGGQLLDHRDSSWKWCWREQCCSGSRALSLRSHWFVKEVIHLTRLAVPIGFMVLTQQFFFIITLLMVGHILGSKELDSISLAQSFSAVTGRSLIIGLSSAADTLCSQSYGYKNYKRVGIVFQRGILLIGTTCFTIASLWLVSDSIFLLLQQDLCVVQLSTQFLRLRALAIPFYLVFIMLERYMQAQSLIWIFVAIGLVQNVVGISFVAIFLYTTNLGVIGVTISMVLFDALSPILLIAYIKGRGLHKKTWGGWSWESLRGWGQFLKLGVAGYLMIAFEWWGFEISTLVTGSISQVQLAANTALFQFANLAYMIPLGYGTAVAIRVGNELGAGNPLAAKRAAFTGVTIELIVALLIMIFFASTRDFIGRIFTDEQAVLDILSPALLASLAALGADQLQGVISGALRGAGKQVLGAVTNFICYYVVGLPIGICLALLANLGVMGMWIGIGIADALQTIAYVGYLLRFNWKKLSDQAVINAGGHIEKKQESDDEDSGQLEESKEGEKEEDGSITSADSKESSGPASDDIAMESTVPLMSEEEEGEEERDVEVREADSIEKELSKRHKLVLLVSKGSVIVVSCIVLLVGVVLAAILHYDYSSCEMDELAIDSLSVIVSSTAAVHSTGRITGTLGPTPTPINVQSATDFTGIIY